MIFRRLFVLFVAGCLLSLHGGRSHAGELLVPKIEGDWWQFSRAPDGSIERAKVSFLRFRRTASGSLIFKGDAWGTEGENLARFDSDLSIIDETSRAFTYNWTGRWFVSREEIKADPAGFYGKGEFVLSPTNRNRASGEYTPDIVNAYALIAFFPFSRLVHILVVPNPYLWRKPQVVRWSYGRPQTR